MENLWFNEDGDCVWGYKSCFESEDAFKKAANDIHVKQTQYGCILGEVECDVFIMTEKTLQGESSYPLKDSGVEIATLFYADCESLESYDLKDNGEIVELDDDTLINLKGERVAKCDTCQVVMPYEEYKKNDGFCNECLADMHN
ncbi:hypothetical protein CDLVIII_1325 [Clostridium sp. DL-VIII]|uniref:hypothetical protein n=1 Tax=Clostridium sp. DL-VIII TaxID=641107 RepID=UPI00023AF7BC|nr:hypothetical protein [Clostridium sp. DL-VIII]EHI98024.1 hypothetical protein CDLVIII_1325 [Clostridium sp. DL-VIII]